MVPGGRAPGHDETTAASHAPSASWEVLVTWEGGSCVAPLATPGAVLVVGRSADCEVCIAHASVSRRHAALHVGASLEVEDLGSANGTRVDGAPVAPGARALVPLGAIVEIGSARLVARVAGEATAAATAAAGSPMARVLEIVERVAKSDISVVLVGESGAGKEVMAERIHERSARAGRPFLRLNCAALPPHLLESELFGYERGAFTGAAQAKPGLFEAANGGSVLLDEIAELAPAIQPKLLRVLESREVMRVGGLRPVAVDVRFIAATHRDLHVLAVLGQFRHDLLFRLNGMTVHVPPLRDRVAEIPSLAGVLLERACARAGRAPLGIDADALALLSAYRWPGNVRELRNVVERAVILCDDVVVRPAHLVFDPAPPPPGGPASLAPPPPPSVVPSAPASAGAPPAADLSPADAAERERILAALDRTAGNQTEAAKLLGVTRRMLAYRLDKLGVRRPRKG